MDMEIYDYINLTIGLAMACFAFAALVSSRKFLLQGKYLRSFLVPGAMVVLAGSILMVMYQYFDLFECRYSSGEYCGMFFFLVWVTIPFVVAYYVAILYAPLLFVLWMWLTFRKTVLVESRGIKIALALSLVLALAFSLILGGFVMYMYKKADGLAHLQQKIQESRSAYSVGVDDFVCFAGTKKDTAPFVSDRIFTVKTSTSTRFYYRQYENPQFDEFFGAKIADDSRVVIRNFHLTRYTECRNSENKSFVDVYNVQYANTLEKEKNNEKWKLSSGANEFICSVTLNEEGVVEDTHKIDTVIVSELNYFYFKKSNDPNADQLIAIERDKDSVNIVGEVPAEMYKSCENSLQQKFTEVYKVYPSN